MDEQGNIIIYQSEDGVIRLDVRLEDKTVWLTQQQMADLFGSSRTNVVEHIKHIFEDEELNEEATCRKFRQVRQEGNREVTREIPYYNLDMIISVGYRIRSIIATRFRQWATERLHEYIVKGFALDDERLKNLGGGSYWKAKLKQVWFCTLLIGLLKYHSTNLPFGKAQTSLALYSLNRFVEISFDKPHARQSTNEFGFALS